MLSHARDERTVEHHLDASTLKAVLHRIGFNTLNERRVIEVPGDASPVGGVERAQGIPNVALGEIRLTLTDSRGIVSWNSSGVAPDFRSLEQMILHPEGTGDIECEVSHGRTLRQLLTPDSLHLSFRRYTEALAAAVNPSKRAGICSLADEMSFEDIVELADGDSSVSSGEFPQLWRNEELAILEFMARETMHRAGRIVGKVAASALTIGWPEARPIHIVIDTPLTRESFMCREGVRLQIAEELLKQRKRGEIVFAPIS